MVLVISTPAGPIGTGCELYGTSDVALVGDECNVAVRDLASGRVMATGYHLVTSAGYWDVILGRGAGAPVYNLAELGLALGATVVVQVDITSGGVIADTLTSSVGWTHDPISRLASAVYIGVQEQLASTGATLGALAARIEDIWNAVYTGAGP